MSEQSPLLALTEILVSLMVDDYLTAQAAPDQAMADERTERVALLDADRAA